MAYLVTALLVGTLIPLQATLNSRLGTVLQHPVAAACINFVVGATVFLTLMALWVGLPSGRALNLAPWYYYLGGVLGSVFVFSAVWLVPKIGTATYLSLLVTGQLLMSAYLDHIGAFGLDRHPATPQKIFGLVLLLSGVFLVVSKR